MRASGTDNVRVRGRKHTCLCHLRLSHEAVVMSGVTVTVKVAHVRCAHRGMMFVRAYCQTLLKGGTKDRAADASLCRR
jgi:hypothetical protein